MKILHLSDTHGLHHRIKDMPEADGIVKQDGIVFSNAALLDDMNRLVRKPRLFNYDL